MRSAYFGFEAARSGLTAAQAGLDTTGNNIANLSTEGYSRQVVDQVASYLGSTSEKIAPAALQAGGLGATVKGINQMRSQFLDIRYRNANSENSANAKTLSVLTDVENNFDETQNDGLSAMLDDFTKQLQVLSLNAGAVEYSSLARSSAQKVAQTLNQYSTQLSTIHDQTVREMQISVDDANGLLGSIAQSNYQIKVATMQHDETNELNDTRGQYLDRLSQYMNIDVIPNSDGTVSVFSGGTKLLDGAQDHIDSDNPPLELESPSGGDTSLTANGTQMDLTGGAFYGAMQVLNGKGGFAGAGENRFRGLPYYQASLDSLANSLSDTFNTLNGAGKPLFTGSGARDIAISDQWLDDPNYITATNDAGDAAKNRGKNDNILKMVEAMDKDQTIGSSNVSFGGYVLSMVGDVAIDVGHTSDISETSDMVFRTVDNQRESMMGVSLNEEAANLIKYQKAFSASARVMTAMDEALDTIINRMGTVGR